MTSNSSKKSKALIWVQLIIGVIVVAWLSYDFFQTLFNGVTYKLRLNEQLYFSQHPFVFIVTVGIKLGAYAFFIWLVRDCISKLKK